MPESEAPARTGTIRSRLLAWYDATKRDLPWRESGDPYRIWVSEVMLQQTRAETVIPYYERWMERFPTAVELAEASLEEVLLEWRGLGYYARARNLHRAANIVGRRFGGLLPRTEEGLRELPGIGEYTAAAIASIAFGLAVPAIDGNARRVFSRLFDLPAPTRGELRGLASELVDPGRPGDFNQAVMEFGALRCTPRSPVCGGCPLERLCLAKSRGTVERRPAPRRRARVREVELAVLAAIDREARVLVVRRPEEGLLGGMWEFPAAEVKGGVHRARRSRTIWRADSESWEGSVPPPPPERPVPRGGRGGTLPKVVRLGDVTAPLQPPEGDLCTLSRGGGGWRGAGSRRWKRRCEVGPLEDLEGVPLSVAQQRIGEGVRRAVWRMEGRCGG